MSEKISSGTECGNCKFCDELDADVLEMLNEEDIFEDVIEELEETVGEIPDDEEYSEDQVKLARARVLEERTEDEEIVGVCVWLPTHIPVARGHYCAQFEEVKRVH